MTFAEFHHGLRILLNIDADEFFEAVYPDKNRYRLPMPDQQANWTAFRNSPHMWFIKAGDADAKAIWAIVEERTKKMKISQCEFCGDDLGGSVNKWPGEPVTCGKRECDRWAADEMRAARDEAHEQLDRDMGWL